MHFDQLALIADRKPSQREMETCDYLSTSLPHLVFVCSGEGRQIWPSRQWTEFTGLAVEEGLGFGWLDAVHTDDRGQVMAEWNAAEASGSYSVQNRVWSKAEGLYRWHVSRGRPIAGPANSRRTWAVSMTDVHDLVERQIRQGVLINELQHRARNLLAVTWSIARKTVDKSESLKGFKQEFRKRVEALSRVQELQGRGESLNIQLHDLVSSELAAHTTGIDAPNLTVSGPRIALSSKAAQTLGLAIHELATNAVKYGALSQPSATLAVTWTSNGPLGLGIRLSWKERGVCMPPDTERRAGYGTELIRRALPFDLHARTDLAFESDGVCCIIEID